MTEKELRMRVGQAIRGRRECLGESRLAIAKRLGMSLGGYRHWESGFRLPSVVELYRLAQVMDCQPREFLPADLQLEMEERV